MTREVTYCHPRSKHPRRGEGHGRERTPADAGGRERPPGRMITDRDIAIARWRWQGTDTPVREVMSTEQVL